MKIQTKRKGEANTTQNQNDGKPGIEKQRNEKKVPSISTIHKFIHMI